MEDLEVFYGRPGVLLVAIEDLDDFQLPKKTCMSSIFHIRFLGLLVAIEDLEVFQWP